MDVNRRLQVQRAAQVDLKVAFQWYESQDCGLGERLLASMEAAFRRIEENPQMYPIRFGSIRRTLVDTFPYGIYFSIGETSIVVHAIYHTSRNPNLLRSRLRKDSP
ncbi:MAG: addiction module toxin RelE [Verrucomicrobiales bacterium VVV1]|nr:MAG: addiction module toxin RelE [Verrucomicrobiales bacterium VVV1]